VARDVCYCQADAKLQQSIKFSELIRGYARDCHLKLHKVP
jgi:hypothetical protein